MADFLGADWHGGDWQTGEGGAFTRGFSSGFDIPALAVLARISVMVGVDTDAEARLARESIMFGVDTPSEARLARISIMFGVGPEDFANLVKFELSDTSDPEVDFGHVLRVRMRKVAEDQAGIVRIRLVQSPDTVISTFEEDLS